MGMCIVRQVGLEGCPIIDSAKFDYFFGRVNSNPHNKARSEQMAIVMK